jgi:hypothetical protein
LIGADQCFAVARNLWLHPRPRLYQAPRPPRR